MIGFIKLPVKVGDEEANLCINIDTITYYGEGNDPNSTIVFFTNGNHEIVRLDVDKVEELINSKLKAHARAYGNGSTYAESYYL